MKARSSKTALNQLTALLDRKLQTQDPDEREEHETEDLNIPPKLLKRFEALMQLEKITRNDTQGLTPEEKQLFSQYLGELYVEKKDTELDVFLEKIEAINTPETKEDIREKNQLIINNAIADSFKRYGRMPGNSQIAHVTGLSRVTVSKHIKELEASENFKDRVKEYQFAKTNIVQSVIKAAVNGDMRAAKLYLSTVDKLPSQQNNTTIINQQNNFIQMDGVTVNFTQLPIDKQLQIKEIISGVLVVKEE